MRLNNVGTAQVALGDRISLARTHAGFSTRDLALLTGIAREHVEAVEAGAEITTTELEAIAQATRKSMDFFLFPEDEVQAVLLRQGQALPHDTIAAIGLLAKFVRDYEFLRSLEG